MRTTFISDLVSQCIVDGVFEPVDAADEAAGVVFHAASGLDAGVIADVQALVRRRILRAFVSRGLIDKSDGEEMGGWEHGGGFSVDASECIAGEDRAGLERLARAIAPVLPFHLSTCNNSMPNIWSTTAPSRARMVQVNWF